MSPPLCSIFAEECCLCQGILIPDPAADASLRDPPPVQPKQPNSVSSEPGAGLYAFVRLATQVKIGESSNKVPFRTMFTIVAAKISPVFFTIKGFCNQPVLLFCHTLVN